MAAKKKITAGRSSAAKSESDVKPKAKGGAKRSGVGEQSAGQDAAAPKQQPPPIVPHEPDLPVVGLGASAGGLEALKVFFQSMPADSGLAFVVVQHLDPVHQSRMTELLSGYTDMGVFEIKHRMQVVPNCVYVIPPNRYVAISDGILHLSIPSKRAGIRMPIDFFFRSLAEDRHRRGICIVLSGTGSDGVLGVRAVRGAGGMAVAQDPTTAQYGDMPQNAIATGLVDYCLPVEDMPDALVNYVSQSYSVAIEGEAPLGDATTNHLETILTLLATRTNRDFRYYKKSTILRRIARRMGLNRIAEASEYIRYLLANADEVTELSKDFLIGVTGFFREPEAFEELRARVIAPLVAGKQFEEAVRIWVPGCASGEEPYSITMLLMEVLGESGKSCPLQVFATDIDTDALEVARAGIYPESIASDVPESHLKRFFRKEGQTYVVNKAVREAVVFAQQNLIMDPPFSKLDLISCRNLLIYLEAEMQRKVVSLFNFSLNAHGHLFMGKSEGVGGRTDLFTTVSKKWRIYKQLKRGRGGPVDLPALAQAHVNVPDAGAAHRHAPQVDR